MLADMSSRTSRIGRLSVLDHDRGVAGMKYVYPVVSRRAGGVSLGVNLNPNNACNWRCVYCQVPDLVYGKGPPLDMKLLEAELREMLRAILHGDFLARSAPEDARRLVDIAFSGNGEPTTSPDFPAAVDVVADALREHGLSGSIKVVLITNGSMLGKPTVVAAVERMAELGGEVWFKLDSATRAGSARINACHASPDEHLAKLITAANSCPTWIQTCFFAWNGAPPSDDEQSAYFECLAGLLQKQVPIAGVHLYTLARPSLQPEAPELSPLDPDWLELRAERIRALGIEVKVSA